MGKFLLLEKKMKKCQIVSYEILEFSFFCTFESVLSIASLKCKEVNRNRSLLPPYKSFVSPTHNISNQLLSVIQFVTCYNFFLSVPGRFDSNFVAISDAEMSSIISWNLLPIIGMLHKYFVEEKLKIFRNIQVLIERQKLPRNL